VLDVASVCADVTELSGAVVVVSVAASGHGALAVTVPSGWVIMVGPSGSKVNAGNGSGSSMRRMIVSATRALKSRRVQRRTSDRWRVAAYQAIGLNG
jgi:hypothetical protein